MKKILRTFFATFAIAIFSTTFLHAQFKDAASFGFSPEKSAAENVKALQKAVDGGGNIVVSKAGVYELNDTVYLDDNTKITFGANVVLKKLKNSSFTYIFLNRGALEKKWNKNIWLDGLTIQVNGVDRPGGCKVYGLCGHVSFFYAKDVKITRFRCYDLARGQFCIHVCTFENLLIDDTIIYGEKDGIHLGKGKTFKLSNGTFRTFDDAIALNAHDYAISNPELGWIEDGVIENMTDLNAENTTGYFCRILAGSWVDWKENLELQNSDTVVTENGLYRVAGKPDGKKYVTKTKPSHKSGNQVIDGINWAFVQSDITHNAGVRNVVFRDIFLYKPRIAFSIHFDNDVWSRSYYPNAPFVAQQNLVFDNVHVMYEKEMPFILTLTPINDVILKNCFLRNNPILIYPRKELNDTSKTTIKMIACTIDATKTFTFLNSNSKIKPIDFISIATTIANDKVEIKRNVPCEESDIDSDFFPNCKIAF